MNNFQNGVTSSDLVPQSFRNSSQNVNFQETYSVSGAQPDSTAQLLYSSSPSGVLSVDDGSNVQVLGVSSTGATTSSPIIAQDSNNYITVALVFLVVAASLSAYFFKRYKSIPAVAEQEQSDDEE